MAALHGQEGGRKGHTTASHAAPQTQLHSRTRAWAHLSLPSSLSSSLLPLSTTDETSLVSQSLQLPAAWPLSWLAWHGIAVHSLTHSHKPTRMHTCPQRSTICVCDKSRASSHRRGGSDTDMTYTHMYCRSASE
mmetsp:Transcript_34240/g.98580  ORF Transcript_34240/g.98580 Transcript_34240/m.98580 type:complete len:134 (-) Transcript_34240:1411-1812(-)